MEIIPAIDLRQGRCVRLYQGDYAQETVFSADPVAMALRWVEQGATRLHIVDLDGAAAGQPANLGAVREIVHAVSVPVQFGGGVRTMEAARSVLALGVSRVILGTAAIEDEAFVRSACADLGGSLVVSVDARDGLVATRGWVQSSAVPAADLLKRMEALGVPRFVYTDISRDGALTGPNYGAIAEAVAATRRPVIAAGGIASVEHLRRLAGLGVEGAIVGRALYTGDVNLRKALAALQEVQ